MPSGLVADGIRVGPAGGGPSAVATTELNERARSLEALSATVRSVMSRLAGADALVSDATAGSVQAPGSVLVAERDIATAVRTLHLAALKADELARALRLAATAYGVAEHVKRHAIEELAARVGWALGFFLPQIAVVAAGVVVPAAAGFVIASGGPEPASRNVQQWLIDNNDLITDPAFVEVLRLASLSLDDIMAGTLHTPPEIALATGDTGIGLTDPETSAAIIAIMGGGIVLGETRVRVTNTGSTRLSTAPSGLADRVARIPKTDENGGSQIRIDRYRHANGPDTFEIYLSGTQDFSLTDTTTPFDLTSNVRMIGDLPAGSAEALARALKDAGVTSSSPIVFTGHSQGALLAHQAAASGYYNVKGVVEVGAPISQNTLPTGANGVTIAHTDDIVTGLGGNRPRDPNQVVVEREAFTAEPVPKDEAVPAHNRDRYEKTASFADASTDRRLVTARTGMDAVSADATSITSTTYRAARD
jgi:hypothetical protein